MMQSSNSKSNLALSPWALAFVALYATTGYFLGKEISIIAGIIFTSAGLLIAMVANQKLKAAGILPKIVLLISPILLVVIFLMRKHNQSVNLDLNYLRGTWIAQNNKEKFIIKVNDGIALLSVEPGLKNVSYLARLRHDSLTLSADSSNVLLMHIIKVDSEVKLDAGGGLLFTKEKKE